MRLQPHPLGYRPGSHRRTSAIRRAGRPVLSSTRSALDATAAIPRAPTNRSGSGSQRLLTWPTHGSVVSSLSIPLIRSASVRPPRLEATRPCPEYPPARASPEARA